MRPGCSSALATCCYLCTGVHPRGRSRQDSWLPKLALWKVGNSRAQYWIARISTGRVPRLIPQPLNPWGPASGPETAGEPDIGCMLDVLCVRICALSCDACCMQYMYAYMLWSVGVILLPTSAASVCECVRGIWHMHVCGVSCSMVCVYMICMGCDVCACSFLLCVHTCLSSVSVRARAFV